jgi:predicted PurR-regulated permease PerM
MLENGRNWMLETNRSRVSVEIPWRTIFKVMAAAVLIWLWLTLVSTVLVLIVALLLAITLNPVVAWFEGRGLPRWAASVVVGLMLLSIVGGFLWLTWASLSDQAHYAAKYLNEIEGDVIGKLPPWLRNVAGIQNGAEMTSWIAPAALRLGQSAASAVVVTLLGFVLTLYLLIEGNATHDWLVAFVPRTRRDKVEQTLVECERVIFAYVAGNVITSIIAFSCTLVALWLLKVPAALLLAVIAGVSDFLPVIGFLVGAVPTVLLALTVSPTTALLVAAFYIGYNTVETYVISPWAYGDRLKLSNVAVILAFVIGAEIAGVIGALIALPIAAIYPAIERIWLRDKLPTDTVREHKAIEQNGAA